MVQKAPLSEPVVSDFKALQRQFGQWLRAPETTPMPTGIEARRLLVYRRLVRNNIDSFLSAGFPVLRKLLSTEQWRDLVDDFVATHSAQSPYFSDMGREFVDFLAVKFSAADGIVDSYPNFTYELAYYERMEVDALFAQVDAGYQQVAAVDAEAALDSSAWWLNDSAQIAQFEHPVAWLRVNDAGEPLQPTAVDNNGYVLLVYRELSLNTVEFIQLQPLTALALNLLQQQSQAQTLGAIQRQLRALLPQLNGDVVDQGVRQLWLDFIQRGVLLQAP